MDCLVLLIQSLKTETINPDFLSLSESCNIESCAVRKYVVLLSNSAEEIDIGLLTLWYSLERI